MDISSLLSQEAAKHKESLNEWEGEIGGEKVKLFATPISAYDTKIVNGKFPNFEQNPSAAAMVYLICHKAVDEDGKKVFNKDKHAPVMERLPLSVTADIASSLFGDDIDVEVDHEEMEKNS